jgi:hypothetical protein
VILSEFWSRYNLQNFRKRKILGDDQGELRNGYKFLKLYGESWPKVEQVSKKVTIPLKTKPRQKSIEEL